MNLNPKDSKPELNPKIDRTLQLSMEAIFWIYNGYYLALKDIEHTTVLFKSAKVIAVTKIAGEMSKLIEKTDMDEVDSFMWVDKSFGTVSREDVCDEFDIDTSTDFLENLDLSVPSNKYSAKYTTSASKKIKKTIEKLRKKSEENFINRDKETNPKPSILNNESLSLLDMAKNYYGYFLAIKNLTGQELSLNDCKAQIIGIAESKDEICKQMPKLIEQGAEMFIELFYSPSKIKVRFLRHELIVSDSLSVEGKGQNVDKSQLLPIGFIHKYFDGCFIALVDVEEKWGKTYKAKVLTATKTEGEMRSQINELIDNKVETFMWGNFHHYTSYNDNILGLPRPRRRHKKTSFLERIEGKLMNHLQALFSLWKSLLSIKK